MKISRNDPFNLEMCIRGLGNLLTGMHSDIYEYMYFLTFRRSMKAYRHEFVHPDEQFVEQTVFFEHTGDPYVSSCFSAYSKLTDCKNELVLRWSIDEIDDLQDDAIQLQA